MENFGELNFMIQFLSLGDVAYETGTANLTRVQGYPTTFCANISLDPSKYNDIVPIHAVAAVDWSNVQTQHYQASAAQTRIVGTEMMACVYIAGGMILMGDPIPVLVWFAYQNNAHHRTNGTVKGGSLHFNTNVFSASLCRELDLPVSIDH